MASRKTITRTVRERTIANTSNNPDGSRSSSSRMPLPLANSTAVGARATGIPRSSASSTVDAVYRAGPPRASSGIPSRIPSQAGSRTGFQSSLRPPSVRSVQQSTSIINPVYRAGPSGASSGRIPARAGSRPEFQPSLRPPSGRSGQSLRAPSGAGRIPSRTGSRTEFQSSVRPPSGRAPQTISRSTISRSNVSIPSAHYVIPAKRGAAMQGGRKVILSSPPNLRQQLEQKPPIGIQTFSNVAQPGTYGASASFLQHPAYEDVQAANVYVSQSSPTRYGPSTRDQSYFEPANTSFMNYGLDPSDAIDYYSEEDLDTSPQLLSPSARTPPHLRAPEESLDFSLGLSSPESSLEKLVEEELERSVAEHPNSTRRIQGHRSHSVSPPVIMGPDGPVQATHQITVGRTISNLPEAEIIDRHASVIDTDSSGVAHETEYDVQRLEPGGLNVSRRGDLAAPLKEVVSITSSLTVAPGISTKTDKAVYQKFNNPEPMSPAEVLKMIEEENDDIELMKDVAPLELKGSFTESFELKKRIQKAKLFPESVKRLEQAIIHHPPSTEKAQEELHPEVMASLMYTEEQRILMEEEPADVCNFLFPPGQDGLVVEVSSAAQAPLQNIVVPGEIPSELHTSGVTSELQTVAGATLESQKEHPTGDLYTAAMLQQRTPKRTAPRIARSPVKEYPIFLDSEEPPFEMEDIQPMIDLVGASPSGAITAEDADTSQPHEEENALEYELTPQPPSHVSRVQLRGSQKPLWFPGYILALPHNLKMAKSVSEVLPAAWQAVQPDIFEEDSIVVVN